MSDKFVKTFEKFQNENVDEALSNEDYHNFIMKGIEITKNNDPSDLAIYIRNMVNKTDKKYLKEFIKEMRKHLDDIEKEV